ncbi:hypothetical protein SEA_SKOG_163 [Gordonia phage Skog]|uniref:Uncharacterized protein n=1 Tax=Gordonia phage Skog TaxID=2704033 RepID=A0A6G6XKD5_9CAUD|nr:hypothetical protein KHQ85_gp163 [Gordonia phage Skog]QIG58315.1 hypothetical protein SEA_SKOG_163 [Gordonia phage Skog]
METNELYRVDDQTLNREQLEAQVRPQLDELNRIQNTDVTFGEYLANSLLVGTIVDVSADV